MNPERLQRSASGDRQLLQRAECAQAEEGQRQTGSGNADCGVKVKKKVTHKKKFRGKVLKQKKAPGTTGAPGLVVPIVIGQK